MELSLSDVQILKLLQEDSRLSYNEISKRTGLSTPTVSSRVDAFTKMGLIKNFTISIDSEMLNEITILLNIEPKPSEVAKISGELEKMDEIRELYILDGTMIYAKTTILDNQALNTLLQNIRAIPDINNIAYNTVTETKKENTRTFLSEGLSVTIPCYYCHKPITSNPVKLKMDNKDHYLCCNTCAKQYTEKYNKLKEGAKEHEHSHQ